MRPPLWLRHVVAWRLLTWLDKHLPGLCWTEMVTWRLGRSEARSWRRTWMCREGAALNGGCYCGKVRP